MRVIIVLSDTSPSEVMNLINKTQTLSIWIPLQSKAVYKRKVKYLSSPFIPGVAPYCTRFFFAFGNDFVYTYSVLFNLTKCNSRPL